MNRTGYDKSTVYFVGNEVEATPAQSKKTLFVIGTPPISQIELMANEYKTPHVFMGANQSFTPMAVAYWSSSITALLDKGYWVTLDYPVQLHDQVLDLLNASIWQSRRFVPMVSVRIPNIETSSPNLTIKIDDIDFGATNRGVWCYNFHELTDSNRFTDWNEYVNDVIVPPMSGPVPNPVLRVPVPIEKITKPVDLESLKQHLSEKLRPTPTTVDQNDQKLGIDTVPTTALKPDPDELKVSLRPALTIPTVSLVQSPADVLEEYTKGTIKDPLSTKPVTGTTHKVKK